MNSRASGPIINAQNCDLPSVSLMRKDYSKEWSDVKVFL